MSEKKKTALASRVPAQPTGVGINDLMPPSEPIYSVPTQPPTQPTELPSSVYGIPSYAGTFLTWVGSDKEHAQFLADGNRPVIEYHRAAPASAQVADTLEQECVKLILRHTKMKESYSRRIFVNEMVELFRTKLRAALAESDKATSRAVKLAIEEHEAACCPEDYGCKEYIAFLEGKQARARAEALEEADKIIDAELGSITDEDAEVRAIQRINRLRHKVRALAAQPTSAPKEQAGE